MDSLLIFFMQKNKWKANKCNTMKSVTPKMLYVCFTFSPYNATWNMLGNHSDGLQQRTTQVNRSWFSHAQLKKLGESLLKQTSWTVAAELERLDLPNDSPCCMNLYKALMKTNSLFSSGSHSASSCHECCQSGDITKWQATEDVEKWDDNELISH